MSETAHRRIEPAGGLWPPGLEGLADLGDEAPKAVWVRGDEDLRLFSPVAIVGSRSCTPYGEYVAAELSRGLAQAGHSVLAEQAFGIGMALMRGVLAVEGHVVALSASGIDRDYPSAAGDLSRRVTIHGSVLTEQPPGTAPTRSAFVARARLVAALSHAVVVVEGALRGSALFTANWAHDLGRPLFAVPGPVTSAQAHVPNRLVQTGVARIVTSAQDVLEELAAATIADPTDPTLERTAP